MNQSTETLTLDAAIDACLPPPAARASHDPLAAATDAYIASQRPSDDEIAVKRLTTELSQAERALTQELNFGSALRGNVETVRELNREKLRITIALNSAKAAAAEARAPRPFAPRVRSQEEIDASRARDRAIFLSSIEGGPLADGCITVANFAAVGMRGAIDACLIVVADESHGADVHRVPGVRLPREGETLQPLGVTAARIDSVGPLRVSGRAVVVASEAIAFGQRVTAAAGGLARVAEHGEPAIAIALGHAFADEPLLVLITH